MTTTPKPQNARRPRRLTWRAVSPLAVRIAAAIVREAGK